MPGGNGEDGVVETHWLWAIEQLGLSARDWHGPGS